MVDVHRQLQEFWQGLDEMVDPVQLDEVIHERIGEGPVRPVTDRVPRGGWKPAWTVAVAGLVTAVGLGGVTLLLLPADEAPPFGDEESSVTTAHPSTTIPYDTWDPILATTRAKPPPPAATCPEGADPRAPGPSDQPRPDSDIWSNQAAAFDRRTGRIVHLDKAGETWTFDVCTNTWQRMDPAVTPAGSGPGYTALGDGAELVYDIDSDLIVSIGSEAVGVYDAGTNTWELRLKPNAYPGSWQSGAVYDPTSGLIVVQIRGRGLAAYDVDTDTWTEIGYTLCSQRMIYDSDADLWSPAEPEPCYPVLVGYAASTDELVFLGPGQLVSPRTGASVPLEAPTGVWLGWGRMAYAVGTDTAIVFGEQACLLVSETGSWACSDFPDGRGIDHYDGFSVLVADPINGRLILIDGHCCAGFSNDQEARHSRDVWAIDSDTGEWINLLVPAGE